MTRRTSVAAFDEIKESGLLSERRFQVYEALFNHGPCTANELRKYLSTSMPNNINLNIVTRLGELRDMGVAYEVRERPCRMTGMTVIEWDVTERLPRKLVKPKKIKCGHCHGHGYFFVKEPRP